MGKKISPKKNSKILKKVSDGKLDDYDQPIEGIFENMSERLMRIQRDLLMPAFVFQSEGVQNTITFFGSAQIKPEGEAKSAYEDAIKRKAPKDTLERLKMDVEMSKYYEAAEDLARRLQEWSNCLDLPPEHKYYIMTGGGPGIMEAANRGAYTAGAKTVGATIHIPDEQRRNDFVAKGVWVNFNYFLMRKFWLLFFAKALVVFPGGTGTFDEFFEVFTLMKTRKTPNYIPTVLFGRKFWEKAVDFPFLVKTGVIRNEDLGFFRFADSVEEAYDYITGELNKRLPKGVNRLCE